MRVLDFDCILCFIQSFLFVMKALMKLDKLELKSKPNEAKVLAISCNDAGTGRPGGHCPPPLIFGRSVNPIPIIGGQVLPTL
jgi:hypothetical protein